MTYQQPLLLLFLLCVAVGLIRLKHCNGRRFAIVALVALFLFSWPPVEWLISRPLETWYPVRPLPPAGADAIVVLDSSVAPPTYERPFPLPDFDTYTRTRFAAWLYRHWKPLPVLAVAGSGDGGPAMRDLLIASGVPETQIWMEQRSHTTYENALYGGQILRQHGIGRIALVVEARSMVRAAACFRKQGFEVVPAPSDFREWDPVSDEVLPSWKAIRGNEITAHEVLGLLWYRLHGWV
ncbi:MAG: YdcF family protein [Bryobacteraceae bacterium]